MAISNDEVFRKAERLATAEFESKNDKTDAGYIRIVGGTRWSGPWLTVAAARRLRDWLNSVLPDTHETRAFPQAPDTDERYNVSDGLLETLIEVAQDNGFRDVVEALRELQVRRGRQSKKAGE